jgi:hypothetical protein
MGGVWESGVVGTGDGRSVGVGSEREWWRVECERESDRDWWGAGLRESGVTGTGGARGCESRE